MQTCNNLLMLKSHDSKSKIKIKNCSEIKLIELFGRGICTISHFLPLESLYNEQISFTGSMCLRHCHVRIMFHKCHFHLKNKIYYLFLILSQINPHSEHNWFLENSRHAPHATQIVLLETWTCCFFVLHLVWMKNA